MEYKKTVNLLGNATQNQLPRYVTRKFVKVYDESDGTYNANKDVTFKIPQLRNNLCDWNDAYIVVTGKIIVTNPSNAAYNIKLDLKNNALFFSCVTRINNRLIDDYQDLDIVMPMYNLLFYSKNYQKTSRSLWNYYRDEPNTGIENGINQSIKD